MSPVSEAEFLIGGIKKDGKAGLVSYTFDLIPTYQDNTLLRGPQKPEVYKITGGKRKHIPSPALFTSYGLRWEDIKIIDQKILERIPEIKLVQAPGDTKVYR